MGFLDTVLRPHLETVTQFYKANESMCLSMLESAKIEQINSKNNAKSKRLQLNHESERFREQGNKIFKAHDWNQALQLYTQSIAAAIEGPLASLAYFNRSAVLFHMKLYEDCIMDIDRALVSGYPKKQQLYSLYLRKAKCLKFLKKNYVGCLADAMKAIMDHNNDEAKKLSELVLCKMEEPSVPDLKVVLPEPNIWKLPELSYGQNPEVPSFSSAINLVHTKKLGRHVIAIKNSNTGDVLIIEESIASSMLIDVQWNFCNFCFKHCNTLIPCKECGYTMYCSENCREIDLSFAHKGDCNQQIHFIPSTTFKLDEFTSPCPETLNISAQSLLFRLITSIGLDDIKKTVLENKHMKSFEDPRTKGFQDGKLQTATLEALLSLEDNFDKLTSSEVHLACQRTIQFCVSLGIPLDQLLPIGAVILKITLVARFNCIGIECFKVNYHADASLSSMQLGRGLFLASSLMNHSCDANMYPVMYGTSAVFRAKRPIVKGEQITLCYTKPATIFCYEERQMELLTHYKFKCSCTACVGSFAPLRYLLPFPKPNIVRQLLLKDAGIDVTTPMEYTELMHFCFNMFPATKEMLPKLLALLQSCHASDHKSNQWYFLLQESIQNHLTTEGNCFFFGDAKKILSGEMDYNIEEMLPEVVVGLKKLGLQ